VSKKSVRPRVELDSVGITREIAGMEARLEYAARRAAYDSGEMQRPRHLGSAGAKAWKRALTHVEARDGDPDLLYDQLELYARAVDRSALANDTWRKSGRPMTAENPNGSSGVHPLLKTIEDADRAVWRYGRALGLAVPGAARRVGHPTAVETRRKAQGVTSPPGRTRKPRRDPRLSLVNEAKR
jgi:phage terminase small subunit